MTLEDLKKEFPLATLDTWHRHKNGGGWVENSAIVKDSACVSGDALVSGNARVSGDVQVSGDAWVLNALTLTGSAHPISLISYTQIAIGCEIRDFADWLKNYKVVGKAHGYTDEQIKEYGEILKYLVKTAKIYVKRNKAKIAGK